MKNSVSNIKQSAFLWKTAAVAAGVGLAASFMQAVQTIHHYKNPEDPLSCDLNSVFSCNSVFDAWQSSFFGFSNSLMCIVFFAVSLGVILTAVDGSAIGRRLRLAVHGATLFFLGFGAWYLWSSAFVIGALCIYCIFCYAAVITLNAAWLRLNVDDLPISVNLIDRLKAAIAKDLDIVFWVLWATAFALMFIYEFA